MALRQAKLKNMQITTAQDFQKFIQWITTGVTQNQAESDVQTTLDNITELNIPKTSLQSVIDAIHTAALDKRYYEFKWHFSWLEQHFIANIERAITLQNEQPSDFIQPVVDAAIIYYRTLPASANVDLECNITRCLMDWMARQGSDLDKLEQAYAHLLEWEMTLLSSYNPLRDVKIRQAISEAWRALSHLWPQQSVQQQAEAYAFVAKSMSAEFAVTDVSEITHAFHLAYVQRFGRMFDNKVQPVARDLAQAAPGRRWAHYRSRCNRKPEK